MKKNYLCLFGLLVIATQLSYSQEIKDSITTQNIEEIKINSKKITIDKNQLVLPDYLLDLNIKINLKNYKKDDI